MNQIVRSCYFFVFLVAVQTQEVPIVKQFSDLRPDGYQWAYETGNGIKAEETGQLKQVGTESVLSAQGGFSYTSLEGNPISLTYIADENGFQPQGDHLPTPPPTAAIPYAIQRALDWIAANPSQN